MNKRIPLLAAGFLPGPAFPQTTPESYPVSFLYTVTGAEAKADDLHIRANLPSSLDYAEVKHLRYADRLWTITFRAEKVVVTNREKKEVVKERIHDRDAAASGLGTCIQAVKKSPLGRPSQTHENACFTA